MKMFARFILCALALSTVIAAPTYADTAVAPGYEEEAARASALLQKTFRPCWMRN
mgnify:CR=1 FL=1